MSISDSIVQRSIPVFLKRNYSPYTIEQGMPPRKALQEMPKGCTYIFVVDGQPILDKELYHVVVPTLYSEIQQVVLLFINYGIEFHHVLLHVILHLKVVVHLDPLEDLVGFRGLLLIEFRIL